MRLRVGKRTHTRRESRRLGRRWRRAARLHSAPVVAAAAPPRSTCPRSLKTMRHGVDGAPTWSTSRYTTGRSPSSEARKAPAQTPTKPPPAETKRRTAASAFNAEGGSVVRARIRRARTERQTPRGGRRRRRRGARHSTAAGAQLGDALVHVARAGILARSRA